MRPRPSPLRLPNTPPPLSLLSEEIFTGLVTLAPVRLYNTYLCGQGGGRIDEDAFFLEAEAAQRSILRRHRQFHKAAEAVQQYIQSYLRQSARGRSLQLGRIQSRAFKEAIYVRCANENTCQHDGETYLYPLFLAKFIIFNEFMDSLALPMSEMHNNSAYVDWLQKVCDEEYKVFHQAGPRQSITSFFLSRQSLTSLELGFCDDTILATIGENLWGLVSLKLTLSHYCSDIGLFWLLHKKVPDEYRKLRELSGFIISTGAKAGKDHKEQLANARKYGKVTLEELQSFVDCDIDILPHAVKMRGCPFLKSLTLYGDIGCFELTEERDIMFRCGLHLILFDCKDLATFEIQIDTASKFKSTNGPGIGNVSFCILNDYLRVTGTLARPCQQTLNISVPALSSEMRESLLHNFIPNCSALNVIDTSSPEITNLFPVKTYRNLSSLMLLRVEMSYIQELLPELAHLKTATFGVDFRSSLSDLVALRNSLLPCKLKRLHLVFEGPRDGEEKVVLEPKKWVPELKVLFHSLASLDPSICKDPNLGHRSSDKTLFQELFENNCLRVAVRRLFLEASPVFNEVNETFAHLESLELSGTFHWAQAFVFAMMTPDLKFFRINPMREIEMESYIFINDPRMTILPYLLVIPLGQLRQLTVAGQDDMFFDKAKIKELLMVLAMSEEFSSLEYFSVGRSLYYSVMHESKFRTTVRLIASGEFKNTFKFDVCHSQFDPLILDAIKIKPEMSRHHTIPMDANSFVY